MERIETQKAQVLADLKNGKEITPLDALTKYGCFRLAAIIHKLRKDYSIVTHRVKESNKTYAKYKLKE